MADPRPTLESAIDKAIDSTVAETRKEEAAQATQAASVAKAASEVSEPEQEQQNETEQETEPETQQTQQTQASDTTDDEPDALSVTPDELAQIRSNPALAKLYKSMNRNYTQKTMQLSQERQLVDALRNPQTRDQAVRLIAEAAGRKLVDDVQSAPKTPTQTQIEQTVDAHIEELNKIFDPAVSKALKPVFERIASDAARAVLEREVTPLREVTTSLAQEAYRAQSEAEVKSFKAAHGKDITPEIEAKMAALFEKIPPSDKVEPVEYMEMLYRIVKEDTKKSDAVKEVTQRMAKAVASQEPKVSVQPGRVASPTEKPRNRDFNQAFDQAYKEALEGR